MVNFRLLFDKIREAAVRHDPNVGSVLYGDVYQLNHLQDIKYPAVVVTSGEHRGNVDEYYFTYQVNLFYVDRLTDNDANKIDVHTSAISFINGLIKDLDETMLIGNYNVRLFNERFNDVCAGAYVTVDISLPISECYDVVGDFPPPPPVPTYDLTDLDVKYDKNGSYVVNTPDGFYGISKVNVDVEVPEIPLVAVEQDITENGETIIEAPEGAGMYEVKITTNVPGLSVDDVRNVYEGGGNTLLIPEGITKLRNLFYYRMNMDSSDPEVTLTFPSTLTTIGSECFKYSKIVGTLIIPYNVTSVGQYAFSRTNIEEVIWNATTGNVQQYTFSYCTYLKRVTFNTPITMIGNYCFGSSGSLELIDFSKCTRVPILSYSSSFTGVPTSCEIRVPAALYNNWITATNWSTLYAQGYHFVAV